MCPLCEVQEIYNICICDKCASYICLNCNYFIPNKLVKLKNSDDTTHLEKIFKKHSKTCNKLTIKENEYDFEFKYCNGCKSQNKELTDKIEEVNEEEESESYNNYCKEVNNGSYQPYLKFIIK